MNEYGEQLLAAVMGAYAQGGIIAKSAGGTGELERVRAVVGPLCDFIGKIDERVRENGRMLEAIVGPPVSQGWVPLDPDRWSVTLTPDAAPRPVNGHGNGHFGGHDLGGQHGG